MVASTEAKRHAAQVVKRLKQAYPDAWCALEFETPFQLLVATILSAQCTDVRVNIVTRELFPCCPDAQAFSKLSQAELEKAIQSAGFFRNKAKSILAASKELMANYDGQLPQSLDEMVALAGVGRKTANVVLGTAFGIPSGVVVDTHVARVSARLGLTRHTDPVKIEHDLAALLPRKEWIHFAHRMIAHGRQVCLARNPKCDQCPLESICPKIGVQPPKGKPLKGKRPTANGTASLGKSGMLKKSVTAKKSGTAKRSGTSRKTGTLRSKAARAK